MLTIYNTTDWTKDQIAPYAQALTAAMIKICRRFGDDVTLEDMALDIASGRHELWLILDNEARFKAFLTTELTLTNMKKRRLTLCQLAGEGGVEITNLIEVIEDWAKQRGVDEICPIGRLGWRKQLAKHGYQPTIIKYRKEI